MNLKRPDMRVHYDYHLALREAVWIRRTGTNHIRSLSEVVEIDALWERDVNVALSVLKWLEDYYKNLTPEDRERLQRVKEQAAIE